MLLMFNRLNLATKFLPPLVAGCMIVLLLDGYFLYSEIKISADQQKTISLTSLRTEQDSAKKSLLTALRSGNRR